MERISKVIEWANEIGREYFLGVVLYETPAAVSYYSVKVTDKRTTRLQKADAYVEVWKKLKEEIGLPSGKLVIGMPSFFWSEELCAEAGTDILIREIPAHWNNLGPIASHYRGLSRSFSNKKYGMTIAPDPPPTQAFYPDEPWAKYYDSGTLRYLDEGEKPSDYEGYPRWLPEGIFKFYVWSYYQGVNYLSYSQLERPLAGNRITDTGKMTLKFLDFIDNNPRGKDIVTKTGIVRSKGCVWGGAKHHYLDNNPKGLGHHPYGKEDMDYVYLNLFYPDFSDNAALTKMLWTGTPYGAVDIIYPRMKLEDMERYNSIIFFGYNRMDSVRADFINDLMKYVRDGGVVLLSIDQLKGIKDELNLDNSENFIGTKAFPDKMEIKDYIEVTEETPFRIDKKRYSIAPIREFYRGEKESPWVYKVTPIEAKVIARDSRGIPILLYNKYGKGYIIFFTSPTLSMIPGEKGKPFERSKFVEDIIDKVCRYKDIPVEISPKNDNVEFLLSRKVDKEATIFIMNHGPDRWQGDIVINLKEAGLSEGIGKNISGKIVKGYENIKEITPETEKRGDNLIIKGIIIEGDTTYSPAFIQARFALIKLCAGP